MGLPKADRKKAEAAIRENYAFLCTNLTFSDIKDKLVDAFILDTSQVDMIGDLRVGGNKDHMEKFLLILTKSNLSVTYPRFIKILKGDENNPMEKDKYTHILDELSKVYDYRLDTSASQRVPAPAGIPFYPGESYMHFISDILYNMDDTTIMVL